MKRSEATLEAARREADLPAFMVGADYWYMPMGPWPHAYGAMMSMTLPWLNPGRKEEVKAAEHLAAAERPRCAPQTAAARYQLSDADAKVRAAREALALIHERVVPDSRRSFESAQAQFQAGQGDVSAVLDAERTFLQVRIDEVRAIAELETSQADYERAAGAPVTALIGGEERR